MHSKASYFSRSLFASFVIPFLAVAALAGGGGGGTIPAPSAVNSMGPIEVPGVTLNNFGVVDGKIFRGEQPRKDEFAQLAAMGIRMIIDLRLDAKSDSRERAESAGLKYINIPIDDHGTPTDDQSVSFLEALKIAGDSPVYVHCAGGRHRTGTMIAVYRMVKNGWTLDQAYQEMLNYDFYTRNGHKGFKTYVYDYYKRVTENPAAVPAVLVPAETTGE